MTREKVVFGTEAATLDSPEEPLFSCLYPLPRAPKVPQNMHALVSRPRGTIRTQNEGRRATAAKTRHQLAQKRRSRNLEKEAAFDLKAENRRYFPLDSAALESPKSGE